jgi:hypothetical protein
LEQYDLQTKQYVCGFNSFDDAVNAIFPSIRDLSWQDVRLTLMRAVRENDGSGIAFAYFWHRRCNSATHNMNAMPKPQLVCHVPRRQHKFIAPPAKEAFMFQFDCATKKCICVFSCQEELEAHMPEMVKHLPTLKDHGYMFGFFWIRAGSQ